MSSKIHNYIFPKRKSHILRYVLKYKFTLILDVFVAHKDIKYRWKYADTFYALCENN